MTLLAVLGLGLGLQSFVLMIRWRERALRLAAALDQIEEARVSDGSPVEIATVALDREWPNRERP